MQWADRGGVDDLPDDRHDDWRQHHRDEKAGADRFEQLRRLVQQQRNAEPDQQLQHHGDRRQFGLYPHRSHEFRRRECLLIVLPGLGEIERTGFGRRQRRQAGNDEPDRRRQCHQRQHAHCRRQPPAQCPSLLACPAAPRQTADPRLWKCRLIQPCLGGHPATATRLYNLTPARCNARSEFCWARCIASFALICCETIVWMVLSISRSIGG